jgi:serine/threonine-protein kinase RsbW
MIELFLPSILGWERVAMDVAAGVALRMGFPPTRIDDIKTAVSEATLNAFEHGNALDASRHVCIAVIPAGEKLEIRVRNRTAQKLAPGIDVEAVPDLHQKLSGLGAARGWGIFLIKSLADEVEVKATPAHLVVRIVMHLNR